MIKDAKSNFHRCLIGKRCLCKFLNTIPISCQKFKETFKYLGFFYYYYFFFNTIIIFLFTASCTKFILTDFYTYRQGHINISKNSLKIVGVVKVVTLKRLFLIIFKSVKDKNVKIFIWININVQTVLFSMAAAWIRVLWGV